jgi:hypothetical protein
MTPGTQVLGPMAAMSLGHFPPAFIELWSSLNFSDASL